MHARHYKQNEKNAPILSINPPILSKKMDKGTNKQTNKQTNKHTNNQTIKQTNKQRNKHKQTTNKQADRHTDKQRNTQSKTTQTTARSTFKRNTKEQQAPLVLLPVLPAQRVPMLRSACFAVRSAQRACQCSCQLRSAVLVD
jgi:hypothetical protein